MRPRFNVGPVFPHGRGVRATGDFRQIATVIDAPILTAAKARGVKLGSARPGHWKGREAARAAGLKKAIKVAATANKKAADEAYIDVVPQMKELRGEGQSLQQIADRLNADGHTTRTGKAWSATQVMRVLA